MAHEARSPPDAPRRAGIEAGAGTEEEGDQMTGDWIMRRCDSCGVLGSDLRAVLVVDRDTGDVVHVAGLSRCGIVVDVLERGEVTP